MPYANLGRVTIFVFSRKHSILQWIVFIGVALQFESLFYQVFGPKKYVNGKSEIKKKVHKISLLKSRRPPTSTNVEAVRIYQRCAEDIFSEAGSYLFWNNFQ